MTFNSIEPFIPSGRDFESSKQLFLALDFQIRWEAGDYIGFQKDGSTFILQNYADRTFAENVMIRVEVSDLEAFWQELVKKELHKRFEIKLKEPTQFPYGREVHLIDLAGVCWHFAGQ